MDNLSILEAVETEDTKIEVLQFNELKGSSDVRTAEKLFYANQAGLKMKMIRITIKESRVRTEPGSLYYMNGELVMKASSGGGLIKGLKRKMLSGETFFVNEIHGSGSIYLEPTFGHFILYKVEEGIDGIIVDKGMFYAGTSGLDITAKMQSRLSAVVLGKEGLFQTYIKGKGIAVLYSPVPFEEIQKFNLSGEKLYVDGNFALLRSNDVKFKVEKSSKSWVATSVSGEGLLSTFEGKGDVWIAPTEGIYEKLAVGSLADLANAPSSRNTRTKKKK